MASQTAELNTLLERGVARADALAHQATDTQQTVDEVRGRASRLSQALARHGEEARQALHGLEGRLQTTEDEVERGAVQAREAMGALRAQAEQASGQARSVVERVRQLAAAERDRREAALANLDDREQAAVSAHSAVLYEIERLQDTLEADVDQTEAATGALREVVQRIRADLERHRQETEDVAAQVEDAAREQMAALTTAAREALAAVTANVRDARERLVEMEAQVRDEAERQLAGQAVAALRERVAAMKDVLTALAETASRRGAETHQNLADLARKHAEVLHLHEQIKPAFDALAGLAG